MSQAVLPTADDADDADDIGGAPPAPVPVPASKSPGRSQADRSGGVATVVLPLAALTLVSLAARLPGMGISLWLDEGLSVGIASHPAAEIPGVLVQDGSPPLYYLLLHGWMALFGSSVEAVRALSLLFASVAVPVAFWAGGKLFGRRAGWIAAALAATSSYLTLYAGEARMYSLVVVLTMVCVTALARALAFGHRRSLPVFVVSLTLLLYTHNWSLYLAVAFALAAVVAKRLGSDLGWREIVFAFGGAAVLYSPWLPTLAAQAVRTGAPWSQRPDLGDLLGAIPTVVGDRAAGLVLLVVAVPALVAARPAWRSAAGRLVAVLVTVGLGALVAAWAASQLEPAWATRYFGFVLAPILLLAAAGLARDRWRGLLALAIVALVWLDPGDRLALFGPPSIPRKSNVGPAAAVVADRLGPGDVVVSTHMEQVPLLHYYLGPDLRYADPMGLVADPTLVDWRDALDRVRSATPEDGLVPLVESLDEGAELVLVCPRLSPVTDIARLRLPWFRAMATNCSDWRATLDADPTLALVEGPVSPPPRRASGSSVYLMVYEKQG